VVARDDRRGILTSSERTQTINQARALILAGPDDLRARFAEHTGRPWRPGSRRYGPAPATSLAMPPASHCAGWDSAPCSPAASSSAPASSSFPWSPRAPGLLALFVIGPSTAALLLIAAGDTPGGCAARPPAA
jgi:hypothetical protein